MPRQITHIKAFHGGLNENSSPSDIDDHECQVADRCNFSTVGQIKPSGQFDNSPSTLSHTVSSSGATDGAGLFTFSSGDTDYYAVSTGTGGKTIKVHVKDGAGIGTVATFSANTGDVNYLLHNGILRICDSGFGTNNDRRWWGNITFTQFPGITGGQQAYSGNYGTLDADIPTPTAGIVRTSDADAAEDTINYRPNAATNGDIPAGNYSFGYTYIYDQVQESRVFKMTFESGTAIAIAADGSLDASKIYFHGAYNKRLTGFRIYIQNQGTYDGDWRMLIDVDVSLGYRLGLGEGYRGTFTGGSGGVMQMEIGNITRLGPETYESINGYKADALIDCSYKSAVVCDGIVYAGHVLQGGVTYPDRILKCAIPVGGVAPDVFPDSHFLDVGTNDGDDIVKLHSFADRVLVFKKKSLAIIAYSQSGVDYIENTYPQMGIDHPGAAFASPKGILFINASGAHVYNGETIQTLTGKQLSPMRSQGWNSGTLVNEMKFSIPDAPPIEYNTINDDDEDSSGVPNNNNNNMR